MRTNEAKTTTPPPSPREPLPQGGGESPQTRVIRACLATQEVIGPFRNGGIGTAYTTLAESLAAAGHEVTLLFLRGDYCESETMPHWIEHYASKGIELVPLPTPEDVRMHGPSEAATSYHAYRWLRERSFDVIHFPELGGFGYVTASAKRQGLGFGDTTICVTTHSPISWIRDSNAEYLHGVSDLAMDFLERQSVAMADVVTSPSRYMLDWTEGHGWTLPPNAYVQQNILPASARGSTTERSPAVDPQTVDELVFFGRLETRKGLELFVDAMDRLAESDSGDFTVTFLGRPARVAGQDSDGYIASRARAWPWLHKVVSDLDQPDAMRYLRKPGRLAVIPSFIENSPYTVLECLGAGIPFLAASVGGIPELIRAEDLAATCFPPTVSALTSTLARALSEGVRLARPAVDFDRNEAEWIRWHQHLPTQCGAQHLPAGPTSATETARSAPSPVVEVRLEAAGEDTAVVERALAAWRAQDYPELVMRVDDELRGRNETSAQAPELFLLTTPHQIPTSASALTTAVNVLRATGADIVTSLADLTRSENDTTHAPDIVDRCLFLGNATALGLFDNVFGGYHLLIKGDVFRVLGGPGSGPGAPWAYLASASLAGYDIQVIPEALYSEPINPEAFTENQAALAASKPYLSCFPPSCGTPGLRELIRFTHALKLRIDALNKADPEDDADEAAPVGLGALVDASELLRSRGELEEARRLIATGATLSQSSPDTGDIINFLLGASQVLERLGDRTAAVEHLATAIHVGSVAGQTETTMKALMGAGIELATLGELDAATSALDSASELAKRHGLHSDRLRASIARGWAGGKIGDAASAKAIILDTLEQARTGSVDDERSLAGLYLFAGERFADLGDAELARRTFVTASQLGWQAGDRALATSAQQLVRASLSGTGSGAAAL